MSWQIFQVLVTNKQWKVVGTVSYGNTTKNEQVARKIIAYLKSRKGLLAKMETIHEASHHGRYIRILAKEPSLFKYEGKAMVHPTHGGEPFVAPVFTVAENATVAKAQARKFLIETFKANPKTLKFGIKKTGLGSKTTQLKYTAGNSRTTVRG